ncbi:ThiF family adenylyltransferase [candidate division KSB1 bacterium]|nr:ThiF family adenylyltransferase [candidate division KSB1 bacterium]
MNTNSSPLSISSKDLEEGRFSRFGQIEWWDQRKLRASKMLVVGAGALGNEVLKNLALLGVGRILVVDMDSIENSNLSRSVLFRSSDIGCSKAKVAAERTRDIYPECKINGINGNVIHDIGLGIFRWADIIIGALDNREARLWINRAAWKMNRPWIDGAIEGLSGVARVFLPGKPPCYECTLGEVDWEILKRRRACNLLTREEMELGKTPTTPTISSIIAGIQVQEALKLLHGLPVLAGKGFIFEGINHTSYVINYTPQTECFSHETYEQIHQWQGKSSETTLRDLHIFAKDKLNANEITLEFSREIIHSLRCPRCETKTEVLACVGKLSYSDGLCPKDGEVREVLTIHSFTGKETFGNKTIRQIGLPAYDVFVARSMERKIHILINES